MPVVRKLSLEEIQDIENKGKGQRKLTEEQYDSFLAGYAVGDYGEATLDENENRLTVRNRFKAAATRRGWALQFNRSTDNVLRFKVVLVDGNGQSYVEPATAFVATDNGSAPAEMLETPIGSDEAPSPPRKRGGRPKKNP